MKLLKNSIGDSTCTTVTFEKYNKHEGARSNIIHLAIVTLL